MRRGDNHWAFLLLSKAGNIEFRGRCRLRGSLQLSLRRLSSISIISNANQIQRTMYFNFYNYDRSEYFCIDVSIVFTFRLKRLVTRLWQKLRTPF